MAGSAYITVNLYPNPTAPLIPLYPKSPAGETGRGKSSPGASGARDGLLATEWRTEWQQRERAIASKPGFRLTRRGLTALAGVTTRLSGNPSGGRLESLVLRFATLSLALLLSLQVNVLLTKSPDWGLNKSVRDIPYSPSKPPYKPTEKMRQMTLGTLTQTPKDRPFTIATGLKKQATIINPMSPS